MQPNSDPTGQRLDLKARLALAGLGAAMVALTLFAGGADRWPATPLQGAFLLICLPALVVGAVFVATAARGESSRWDIGPDGVRIRNRTLLGSRIRRIPLALIRSAEVERLGPQTGPERWVVRLRLRRASLISGAMAGQREALDFVRRLEQLRHARA